MSSFWRIIISVLPRLSSQLIFVPPPTRHRDEGPCGVALKDLWNSMAGDPATACPILSLPFQNCGVPRCCAQHAPDTPKHSSRGDRRGAPGRWTTLVSLCAVSRGIKMTSAETVAEAIT
jgi:hypothetical protein